MPPLPYRFADDRRAVEIHRPDLPAPWINYLSNGNLHAFVSQAAGGLAWWRTPLKARLTRYRLSNLPLDTPVFYLYLRESDGTVWSPGWRPAETPLDAWRAEHQPGLTRFAARRGPLTATLDLFIPPGCNVLVWDLALHNGGGRAADLDVFAYVEFSLLDWKQDTDWSCYVKHNLQVWHETSAGAIFYLYRHFHFNPWLAHCPLVWFSAATPADSHDCDRDAFIGAYRTERLPAAVEGGRCGNTDLLCGEPCAALQHRLSVPPGASRRLPYFLGTQERATTAWPRAREEAREVLSRLRSPGEVDRLKDGVRQWWAEHFAPLQVVLPDPDVARQVNTWGPVQCVHTARYSRSISTSAAGVRTLGFRDTCQDLLAVVPRRPTWARDGLLYLLSQQYEDGHTPHQCNPVEGLPAEPRIHIDNPLWLPLLAHALVAETGDLDLLDTLVPWLSARDHLSPTGMATVWEHLRRVSDFLEANLGAHGLPLTHHGDWNDSIGKFSRRGRGESVMAGQQYAYALRLLAGLARFRGDPGGAAVLEERRESQVATLHAHAWDGAWWRRGFDDDGNPIGSSACAHGQIWLNPQSWAVLAGVGTRQQQTQALDAVAARLDTGRCGLKKLDPSFPSFPEAPDPYSGYSPGCGENGAIFCHANTWAIIAESLLGRAGRAWRYYRQLLPHLALQEMGLERYQAEPYAYVSNIVGPENPRYGWANVTQVTGTAAWMDLAATQYLLGLRPELDGLRVDPVLPGDWPGFTATRRFRGCELAVTVRRGESGGVQVDGQSLESTLVPASVLPVRGRVQILVSVP